MNTAARMESTSTMSHIQVSSATAEELTKWKRGKWIKPRDGTVMVKGKGNMQTYWLETKEESNQRAKLGKASKHRRETVEMAVLQETDDEGTETSLAEDEEETYHDNEDKKMTKTERLVEWNVEVLKKLLQQILAARADYTLEKGRNNIQKLAKVEVELKGGSEEGNHEGGGGNTKVLDEFQEIITIPYMNVNELRKRKDPDSILIPPQVVEQLRDLLSLIACFYRPNPFHNFEHASHVTSSVRKLLTRIVKANDQQQLVDLAGHSYGITSDPITQFAVVFSAVIHDADHPGVPNATLVQENTRLAQIYRKSIAEQNSVDLTWSLLMSPKYVDLRGCIYSNEEELRRFRQLVVNTVMATDIVDKELQALRKARWETAFSDTKAPDELDMNRKATIVIEHLIQASDVSHTMQHWQ
jgi:3'5'-cyclic nucleotide phosphodiesterase/Adenylate and Guanylate cyclase catalytic domain